MLASIDDNQFYKKLLWYNASTVRFGKLLIVIFHLQFSSAIFRYTLWIAETYALTRYIMKYFFRR